MSNDRTSADTILITGGTGKTGRRLAERLTSHGVPVRIGSRSADIPFDWEDRTTWDGALDGVSAAYLSYYPDLALPGAAETVEAFALRALEKGVRRLVLLSGRGEEGAEKAEKLFEATGADWTVLRAAWFAQNFSENYMIDGILEGELALPVGDVGEPFIDADDIADIAFACFTEPGHIGTLYELTGPRLLTFAEAVGEIATATGRDIRFRRVAIDKFVAALHEQQVPQPFIDLMIELFTQVLDGRNERLADGVQRALGRAPRDFADYVRRTAASGVWDAQAPAAS
ncbi:NAD(P)H-binding protein [Chelativorans xinjiangense]|uniref:NAD(P)H-binding protein n=1 Tax=Chelativorans xinjiangense TaxID=2681485 RepID=UPI00135A078B|nr:NAD(P)H-binding protein [Chelativorans xinjiangense]